jgi:hypothetical protein
VTGSADIAVLRAEPDVTGAVWRHREQLRHTIATRWPGFV